MTPRPRVIWMQLGVRNDEAAARAEAAGIKVVMNRCPKIEYGRLSSEISWIGINSRTLTSKTRAALRPRRPAHVAQSHDHGGRHIGASIAPRENDDARQARPIGASISGFVAAAARIIPIRHARCRLDARPGFAKPVTRPPRIDRTRHPEDRP